MNDKLVFKTFLTFVICAWSVCFFSASAVFAAFLSFLICTLILKLVFKRKVAIQVVLLCAALISGMYTNFSLDVSRHKLSEYDGKKCRVYAKIGEIQNENDYYDTYIALVDKITDVYGEHEVDINEKVNLSVKNGNKRKLSYGDYICTIAEIEEVKGANNRGEADYSLSNKVDSIFYKAVAKNSDIKIYYQDNKISDIYDAAHYVREYIKDISYEKLDEKYASVLCAIMISERKMLGAQTKEILDKAGITHISAASGTHVGCIICIIVFVLGLFNVKRKYAKLASLPFLFMYVFINNCSPSVTRAGICAALAVMADIIRRDEDKLTTISTAGLIILSINPLSVFDIGFVMSFSCVFSIALFFEPIMNFFRRVFLHKCITKVRTYKFFYSVCSTFAVSLSAQIAVVPICSYYFGKINIYALLSNMLISWALMPLLFSAVFVLIFGKMKIVCVPFVFLAKAFCAYILNCAKIIADFPFSQIEFWITPVMIAVYLTVMLAMVKMFKRKFKTACVVWCVCGILLIVNLSVGADNAMSANFVNVGQADGCFVKTDGESAVVIDAGGSVASDKDKVFCPYMKRCGVKNIKYIFVSHFDTDHAKNVEDVIDNFNVSNIVLPYRSEKAKISLRDEIIEKASERGINVIYAADKDVFEISENVCAYVYAPPRGIKYFEDENEGSMALKLCVNDKKILFLGDLSVDIQETMALKYKDELKCDILKVSHHGSFKSYSHALVYYARPEYALISCGDKNIYSHPDDETVDDLLKRKISVLTTASCHDVRFYLNETKIICDPARTGE